MGFWRANCAGSETISRAARYMTMYLAEREVLFLFPAANYNSNSCRYFRLFEREQSRAMGPPP